MLRTCLLTFFITVYLLTMGCSRKDESKSVTKTEPSLSQSNIVLVAVGEQTYTRRDIEDFVSFRTDVEYLVNPNFSANMEIEFKCRLLRNEIEGWVVRTLLLREAQKLNCKVDEKQIDMQAGTILKRLKAHRHSQTPIGKRFNKQKEARLRSMIHDELLAQEAQKKIVSSAQKVTDDEIALRYKQLEEYNQMAQLTNNIVFARATNVWHQLKAGGDWDDLVAKYSEDDPVLDHGEWTIFSMEDLGKMGADFKARVLELEEKGVPSISSPLENDNGVMIIQLAGLQRQNKGEPPGYVVNRIYFRLPIFYKVPTRDEMRELLAEIHRNEAYSKWLSEAKSAAKIVYPEGEDIAVKMAEDLQRASMPTPPKRRIPQ